MAERNYTAIAEEYYEKFGEIFPSRMAPGNEQDKMDIMEECLKTGQPYDPYAQEDFDPEADY